MKTRLKLVLVGVRTLLKAFIPVKAQKSTNKIEPRTMVTVFLRLALGCTGPSS